ncbi:MAG: amidohydrolase family protein [Desulfatirhabdiaceae bacterium]
MTKNLPLDGIIGAEWLIDGTGDRPQSHVWINIHDGIISGIYTCLNDIPVRQYPDTCPEILDLSGCTLMPSWIDCHVHLTMSGTLDADIRKAQLKTDYQQACATIRTHLRDHARWGIAAVRDGGDGEAHTLLFKHENGRSSDSPVYIKAAGKAWRQSGRYGKLIGDCPDLGETLTEAILKSLKKPGFRPDHVKIVNSGLNSLTRFGKETPPQFSASEMTPAIVCANQMGLPVMVHANGTLPVRMAIESGCSSIEHGFFMGRANLERLADKQITWVPTAVTMDAYSNCFSSGSIEADMARRNLEHQIAQIELAGKLGVPVALGTDSGSMGVFHGDSAKQELNLLLQAGFSVSKAVQCATQNGARLLGISNLGSIQPGKQACFTVIQGSPDQLAACLHTLKGLS